MMASHYGVFKWLDKKERRRYETAVVANVASIKRRDHTVESEAIDMILETRKPKTFKQ